ncbi:MAG TPA: non-ribosomal peptide synthetase [Longimicrobium sp.]
MTLLAVGDIPLSPGGAPPGRGRRSLVDLFREQAAADPSRAAVRGMEDTWTYGELDEASDRLAHGLRALGVRRGDTVAVVSTRSPGLIVALLGVLKSGGRFVISDASRFSRDQLAGLRRVHPAVAVAVGEGETMEGVHAVLREQPGLSVISLAGGRKRETERSLSPFPGGPVPDLPTGEWYAYYAFTSASTGKPKIVSGRHGAVANFLEWYAGHGELGLDDRFAMLSALPHDPLLRDVFTPLSVGASILVPTDELRSRPLELVDWLRDRRATIAHLTPSFAATLASRNPHPVDSLRIVGLAGEALDFARVRAIRRLAPSATLLNFYGATETPQVMGCHVVRRDAAAAGEDGGVLIPVGRGIGGARLLVLDEEMQPCGVAVPGEVFIQSAHLTDGYHDDPVLTAERFIANPLGDGSVARLYRTGDTGYYLRSGEVVVTGRCDRQVKLNGARVDLGEVEGVLREHPRVREAAVRVRGPASQARVMEAFVVLDGAGAPDDAALRRYAVERLAAVAVPAVFHRMERLPMSENGKIDYRRLDALIPAPPCAALDEPPPAEGNATHGAVRLEGLEFVPAGANGHDRTLEEQVTAVWRELLGRPSIDPWDNVFEFGAQSLTAAEATARIAVVVGSAVDVMDIYMYPIIRDFVRTRRSAVPVGAAETRMRTDAVDNRRRAMERAKLRRRD